MTSKRTEKEVNFALADLLRSKHPRWRGRLLAERTGVFENRGLAPDIFLRRRRTLGSVVVETEFEPGRTVEEDARARLGQRFSESGSVVEQVVAAKLPRGLRTGGGPLEESLGESSFRYCVWSGTPSDALRWPKRGWLSGGIDDLARCVELCASSERLLSKGLEVMENAIRWSAAEVKAEAESLRSGKDLDSALGAALRQKGGIQTRRMAMAIVLNAMAFHAALAEVHAQVRGIESLRDAEEPRGLDAWTVMREWTRIVKNINYYPIFSVAIKILEILPRGLASRVLEQHAGAARKLARLEVTAVHDLSGRAFQRLISDRRFLATFYTLPTSAQLLAELAVQRMDFDWSDLKSYPRLRAADLACGTGTLLSAAYSAILSRYRRAGGDDMDIHREMVENAMIAADIMPAGVHLAASQISSAHPRIGFSRTRFYTMRFGRGGEGPDRGTGGLSLGSLDLIDQQRAGSLFGTGHEEVHGGGRRETKSVRVPHGGMDLVIMNPPFTRPTNHERAPTDDSGKVMPVPSFAGFSTSREDQKAMSARLKKLRRALSQPAGNGHAGLASDFIDLAHKKIKPGQPIAFVLPFSVVRGKSWGGVTAPFVKPVREYRDHLNRGVRVRESSLFGGHRNRRSVAAREPEKNAAARGRGFSDRPVRQSAPEAEKRDGGGGGRFRDQSNGARAERRAAGVALSGGRGVGKRHPRAAGGRRLRRRARGGACPRDAAAAKLGACAPEAGFADSAAHDNSGRLGKSRTRGPVHRKPDEGSAVGAGTVLDRGRERGGKLSGALGARGGEGADDRGVAGLQGNRARRWTSPGRAPRHAGVGGERLVHRDATALQPGLWSQLPELGGLSDAGADAWRKGLAELRRARCSVGCAARALVQHHAGMHVPLVARDAHTAGASGDHRLGAEAPPGDGCPGALG